MILIDEIIVENVNIKFYDGIDFDLLLNHSRDGSDGFIFCFINNWVTEVKSYNRQRKLTSVVDDISYEEFDWEKIDNNYISVYQTEGVGVSSVYQVIRSKVERNQFEHKQWVPVDSILTGAWNLSKRPEIRKIIN
jgi:hypothetical protein